MQYTIKVMCQAPIAKGQRVRYDFVEQKYRKVSTNTAEDALEGIFIAEEEVLVDRRAKLLAPSEPLTFYYSEYPFLQNMQNGLVFSDPNANVLGWTSSLASTYSQLSAGDITEAFGYLIKIDATKCNVYLTTRKLWSK